MESTLLVLRERLPDSAIAPPCHFALFVVRVSSLNVALPIDVVDPVASSRRDSSGIDPPPLPSPGGAGGGPPSPPPSPGGAGGGGAAAAGGGGGDIVTDISSKFE